MRRTTLILLIVSGLTFLAGLGRPAITDSDEAFYAEAAREMVETGDWLTPHYNYQVRFQKPILYYWLTAATYVVAGVSEFAARLWSALAGVGLVLLTAATARRWHGEETARLAGLVAATSFGYFAMARMSLPDLPLAFFVTASIWTAIVGLLDGGEPAKAAMSGGSGAPPEAKTRSSLAWLVASGAAGGLAFLTKGPIGIVLPAVVVLPLVVIEWRRIRLRPMHLAAAAAAFLLVATPWYFEMWRVHGAEYYRSFFIGDNLERFATTRFNDPRGFAYYGPVILGGLLPWSPFLLLLVPPAVAAVQKRQLSTAAVRLLTWAVLPLVVFTVSVGKQPRYILPVLPPLAILLARELAARVAVRPQARQRDTLLLATGSLAALAFAALAVVLIRIRPLLAGVPPALPPMAAGAVFVGAAAVAAATWVRARSVASAVTVAAVAALLSGQYVVLSMRGPETVEKVAAVVRSELPAARGWMVWGESLFVRNLVFYVKSRQTQAYEWRAVVDTIGAAGPMVVVMREEDVARLEAEEGLSVRRLGEFTYFNTASLTPRRLLWPDPSRDSSRVVVARAERGS